MQQKTIAVSIDTSITPFPTWHHTIPESTLGKHSDIPCGGKHDCITEPESNCVKGKVRFLEIISTPIHNPTINDDNNMTSEAPTAVHVVTVDHTRQDGREGNVVAGHLVVDDAQLGNGQEHIHQLSARHPRHVVSQASSRL